MYSQRVHRPATRDTLLLFYTHLEGLAAWFTGSCFTARRVANQIGIRFLTESLAAWYLRGNVWVGGDQK